MSLTLWNAFCDGWIGRGKATLSTEHEGSSSLLPCVKTNNGSFLLLQMFIVESSQLLQSDLEGVSAFWDLPTQMDVRLLCASTPYKMRCKKIQKGSEQKRKWALILIAFCFFGGGDPSLDLRDWLCHIFYIHVHHSGSLHSIYTIQPVDWSTKHLVFWFITI